MASSKRESLYRLRLPARIAWLLIPILFSVSAPAPLQADEDIETTGDVLQIVLPAAAYGMTFAYDDPEGRIQFYQSFFSAMGVNYALKLTVDKERPNGGDMSFPSGHTAAAFSGATFIQMRYGWLFGSVAYAGAAFVGWSRVETDKHYPEDVIAGAAIGIVSAKIFTKPFLDKIHFLPFVSEERVELAVSFDW